MYFVMVILLSVTTAVSAGELKQASVKLDGSQCVTPVSTKATGAAQLSLSSASGDMIGSLNLSGIDARKAHIHRGGKGENGKVVVTLEKQEDGSFVIPGFTTLAQSDVAVLLAGGMYLQVHSAKFPKGELRGQIIFP